MGIGLSVKGVDGGFGYHKRGAPRGQGKSSGCREGIQEKIPGMATDVEYGGGRGPRIKKIRSSSDKQRNAIIFSREGKVMKPQEAISILMLSPCYWRMKVTQRRELVKEFLANYAAVSMAFPGSANKKKEDS